VCDRQLVCGLPAHPEGPGSLWNGHLYIDHQNESRETHMSGTTETSAGATAIRLFTIEIPEAEVRAAFRTLR
jgi:hypothetical protein